VRRTDQVGRSDQLRPDDVGTRGDEDVMVEPNQQVGDSTQVVRRRVLTRFGAGERGPGQQRDHGRRVVVQHGEAPDGARHQEPRDSLGAGQQLAVGHGAVVNDNCRALRVVARHPAQEFDHTSETAPAR
jgi:hypothetical protein